MSSCLAEKCANRAVSCGLCPKHYQRYLRSVIHYKPKPKKENKCWLNGCTAKAQSKNLCDKHYGLIGRYNRKGLLDKCHRRWGIIKADYPFHNVMKRNRLKKLKQCRGICEACKKNRAVTIHHIDGSRDNHELSNLTALCKKCHIVLHSGIVWPHNTKFFRKYGKSAQEVSRQLKLSAPMVYRLHNKGILKNMLVG